MGAVYKGGFSHLALSKELNIQKSFKRRKHILKDPNLVVGEELLALLDHVSGLDGLAADLANEASARAVDLTTHHPNRIDLTAAGNDSVWLYMEKCWAWVRQSIQLSELHVKNAAVYHQFHHSADELCLLMETFGSTVNLHPTLVTPADPLSGGASATRYLQDHLNTFHQWHNGCQSLLRLSGSLVPVHLRTESPYRPKQAVWLCHYQSPTEDLRLEPQESITVVDSTRTSVWMVRTSQGRVVEVPSLGCLVLGPDHAASDKVEKLLFLLKTVWTSILRHIWPHILEVVKTIIREYLHDRLVVNDSLRTELIRFLMDFDSSLMKRVVIEDCGFATNDDCYWSHDLKLCLEKLRVCKLHYREQTRENRQHCRILKVADLDQLRLMITVFKEHLFHIKTISKLLPRETLPTENNWKPDYKQGDIGKIIYPELDNISESSSDTFKTPDHQSLELDLIPRKEPKTRLSCLYWQVKDLSHPPLHVSVRNITPKSTISTTDHIFRTRRLLHITGDGSGEHSTTVRHFEVSSVKKPRNIYKPVVDGNSSYVENVRQLKDVHVQVELIKDERREIDHMEDKVHKQDSKLKRSKSPDVEDDPEVDHVEEKLKRSKSKVGFKRTMNSTSQTPSTNLPTSSTGVQIDLYREIDHEEEKLKNSKSKVGFKRTMNSTSQTPSTNLSTSSTGVQIDLYREIDHEEEKLKRSKSKVGFKRTMNSTSQTPSTNLSTSSTGVQIDLYTEIDHEEEKRKTQERSKFEFKRTNDSKTQTQTSSKLITEGSQTQPQNLVNVHNHYETECASTASQSTKLQDSELQKSETKRAQQPIDKIVQIGTNLNDLITQSTQTFELIMDSNDDDDDDDDMLPPTQEDIIIIKKRSDTAASLRDLPKDPDESIPKSEVKIIDVPPKYSLSSCATQTQLLQEEPGVLVGSSSFTVASNEAKSQTTRTTTFTSQTQTPPCKVSVSDETITKKNDDVLKEPNKTILATSASQTSSSVKAGNSFHLTPSSAADCQTQLVSKQNCAMQTIHEYENIACQTRQLRTRSKRVQISSVGQDLGCQVETLIRPTEHYSVQTTPVLVKDLGSGASSEVRPTNHFATQTTIKSFQNLGCQVTYIVTPTIHIAAQTNIPVKTLGCQIQSLVMPTETVAAETMIEQYSLGCQVSILKMPSENMISQTYIAVSDMDCQVTTLKLPSEHISVQTTQIQMTTEATQQIPSRGHKSCIADSLLAPTEHICVQASGPEVTSRAIQQNPVNVNLGCQAITLVLPTENLALQTDPLYGTQSIEIQAQSKMFNIGLQIVPPPWSFAHESEQTDPWDFTRNKRIQFSPAAIPAWTQSEKMRLSEGCSYVSTEESDRAIQAQIFPLSTMFTQVPPTLVIDTGLQAIPITRDVASIVGPDLKWGADHGSQVDTEVEVLTRVVYRSSTLDSLDVVAINQRLEST